MAISVNCPSSRFSSAQTVGSVATTCSVETGVLRLLGSANKTKFSAFMKNIPGNRLQIHLGNQKHNFKLISLEDPKEYPFCPCTFWCEPKCPVSCVQTGSNAPHHYNVSESAGEKTVVRSWSIFITFSQQKQKYLKTMR